MQKVCALLRALAAPGPRRLSELAAETGLNKVTALRILDTLAQEGFVARAPDGRGWRPGPESLALAAGAGRPDDLRALARPSLVRLAEISGDTVLLSVRSGVEAVCVERETGSYPIRANYLDIGSRRPLGVGAGSLALLAWLPDREVDAILGIVAGRLEAYPRLGLAAIREAVAAARARGYVVLLDRVVDTMGAIGVPVRDPGGRTVAALSIAALSARLAAREAMLAEALRREADLMERERVPADTRGRAS
ncbi:IclR family transcriptional regulator [Methylobacterium crusticola]|uniref:IclR family transcriptional regulator n=1 Tax=Methylobacterium crusticola TaxID=1697972 RepID=UPI001396C7A3|nr:IclR family transcriptional regulator C-terminal domain-containing protein [Methylobacterium crusticola]